MRYTVTIKDNESGEILREVECKAIVGGIAINEEESASLVVSSCSGEELLEACKSAKKGILKAIEGNTALKVMFTIFEMALNMKERDELMKKLEEKEDADND
jgi:hypothetical protein